MVSARLPSNWEALLTIDFNSTKSTQRQFKMSNLNSIKITLQSLFNLNFERSFEAISSRMFKLEILVSAFSPKDVVETQPYFC